MAYREGDVDSIVTLTAQSAFRAVHNATQLVTEIRAIQASWRERVKARSDSTIWKVLDVIAKNPVVSAASLAKAIGTQVPNAYPHLKSLVDAGILKARGEYKRGTFWRSEEILGALDSFVERAGRRS